MSSPILPFTSPSGQTDVPPARAGADRIAAFLSSLSADVTAPQAGRGTPPEEVLDQVHAAGAFERRLRESGRRLAFTPGAGGRRAGVELHERDGQITRLSVAEAAEISLGKL